MQKKSVFLILIFLLAITVEAVQSKSVEEPLIFKIIKIDDVKTLRNWLSISLLYPDQYHTPEELIEELYQINDTAPGIIDLYSIGKSVEGRDIFCVRITNEQNTLPKAGVLFVSHHHAREQITVEVGLRFILTLVNSYGLNPDMTKFVNEEEIFFIPTLNPDGLHYVVGNKTIQGNPWYRKNFRSIDDDNDGEFNEDPPEDTNGDGIISEFIVYTQNQFNDWTVSDSYYEGFDNDGDGLVNEDPLSGVDLNRNYDYRWNDSSCDSGWTTDTTLDDYPGSAPFSEPETQAFREFVENKDFATSISLHSGVNGTYFPWASETYYAEEELYKKIYSDLISLLPLNYLTAAEDQEYIGYTCGGEWGDWMYAVKNCLVPLTFEIYHNTSSDDLVEFVSEDETKKIWQWDGIYEKFAPVESAIEDVWSDIQSIFSYWLVITPRLEASIKSVVGDKNMSDTLEVTVILKSLSPVIGSVTEINVVKESLNPVIRKESPVTISEIPAESSVEKSFKFELEQDFARGSNLTFLIGNKYMGYKPLTIQEDQVEEAQVTIDLIIPFFAIATLVVIKSRKQMSRMD
ncbi:MAG: M14 family zinc carboxypeptidase [Promethearchaeota archaeon]